MSKSVLERNFSDEKKSFLKHSSKSPMILGEVIGGLYEDRVDNYGERKKVTFSGHFIIFGQEERGIFFISLYLTIFGQ